MIPRWLSCKHFRIHFLRIGGIITQVLQTSLYFLLKKRRLFAVSINFRPTKLRTMNDYTKSMAPGWFFSYFSTFYLSNKYRSLKQNLLSLWNWVIYLNNQYLHALDLIYISEYNYIQLKLSTIFVCVKKLKLEFLFPQIKYPTMVYGLLWH